METPTSFDLSQAITQWRERLANVPGIQPGNVSELESHLRDSIAALGAQGLTDEECFFVATHRLGSGAQLGSEFEKVNRRSIWLERVMWMLAGILLLRFVDTIAGTISFVVMAISKLVGMPKPFWTHRLAGISKQ